MIKPQKPTLNCQSTQFYGYPQTIQKWAGAILIWLVVSLSTSVLAGDDEDPGDAELKGVSTTTAKSIFAFKGYVESTLKLENDFDLNPNKKDDVVTHAPEAGLRLQVSPSRQLELLIETELSRLDYVQNDTDKTDKDWELNIRQAYIEFDAQKNISLRVGRQQFEDEMEWWYDAYLDGVRLFYETNKFKLELASMREDRFNGELLNDPKPKDEDIRDLALVAHFTPAKKVSVSAYLISIDEKRFNGNNPEDLRFFGIQSTGKFTPGFKHWLNAAQVTGKRARSNDVRTIEAYAYDLGATFISDSSTKPSFTLGFAHGSGDARRNEGKDTNFRQTGLQGNNYRFNGVTNFKYLGELFDPEITNLSILTLGFGIRPTRRSSLDIVYHRYVQDQIVDRLSGTNIERDPQGINKELGHELDFIIGSREIKQVYLEAVLGVFSPDSGFKSNASTAYFAAVELGFKF